MSRPISSGRSLKGPVILVLGVIAVLAFMLTFGSLAENVDASELAVFQSPTGNLTCHVDPGWKWQGFADVTKYPRRGIYTFDGKTIQVDGQPFEGARITFNDAAESALGGSIQYEYPLDCENILDLHTQYRSAEAVQQQLIEAVVDNAILMTGTLLSSKESYAERRADMMFWVEDQIRNGIYQTTQVETIETDPLTGETRTTRVAQISRDEDGNVLRQGEGQLNAFGVIPRTFAPTDVIYPPRVRKQIDTQQDNIMAVQTARAEALKAEQEKITVAQQGEANATRAKWEQEVEKARRVTEAEQKREVARLDQEAAEFEKAAAIARGQGEAEARRLVMQADNALDRRLQSYERIMVAFAENFKNLPVPTVVMGESEGGGERAADLINLLTAKTARELGVSINPGDQRR